MTAAQVKRIRTRLEKAAALLKEANELYQELNPYRSLGDHRLRTITASASDAGTRIMRDLEHYDSDLRMEAERMAREHAPLEVGDIVADKNVPGTYQVRGIIQSIHHDGTMATIREPDWDTTADRPVSKLFRIPEMALRRD